MEAIFRIKMRKDYATKDRKRPISNIFYQALTLEYRSTEPCSCYNKAIDEICRRLELHRKRGILSIVALITFINGIIKACSFTFLKYILYFCYILLEI